MTSNLELLTSTAEYLLKVVTDNEDEDDDNETDNLPATLETFKTVSLCMPGDDLQLSLLTIRCVSKIMFCTYNWYLANAWSNRSFTQKFESLILFYFDCISLLNYNYP